MKKLLNKLPYILIGIALAIAGTAYSASVFNSQQLAPNPSNGNCLTTNGGNPGVNAWSSSCGSGGGSSATTTINGASGPAFTFTGSGITIATSTGAVSFTASGGGGSTATTTVNGASGPNFTFSTSTSGSNFNISTSTNAVQFNIPYADATHTGLLQGSDWNTFNSKQAALSFPLAVNLGGTGSTSLNTTLVPEGTNLYFTNARAQNAISLTTTGTSGAATYSGGTLNIPQYQGAGNYLTALTGDGTASGPGSAALTLATVNSNVGTYGNASTVPVVTVNGKGLVTGVSTSSIYSAFSASNPITFSNGAIGWTNSNNYITLGSLTGDSPITYNTGTGHIGFTNPGYITGNQNITVSGAMSGSGATAIPLSFASTTPIAYGGTGITTAPAVTGQLLMASSTGWTVGNLLAGTNITLTTSTPGSITINASASGGSSATTTITSNVLINGPSFIFATSTSGGLSQTITGTGTTITWTLQPATNYSIPLTASTTAWNNFYNTPSTQITAGTNLAWSGNTLNGNMASSTIIAGGTATYSPSITFATSTDTNLLLQIVCSTATCIFTPQWTSTLADARIASAANWNGVYNNVLSRLAIASSTTGSNWYISTSTNSLTLNIPVASASATGTLTATDWTTFNNKQASGAYLTGVTADSPLGGSGTTGSHLTFTNPGYILGNQTITVTGDATGTGATSIVLGLKNTGSAGSCTNCNITFDAQGRETAQTNGSGGGVATTSPFSAGYIPEATGTNASLSNSNIFQATGGNIGINSTTPSANLVVQGASGQTTPILVVASSSNASLVTLGINSSGAAIQYNTTTMQSEIALVGNSSNPTCPLITLASSTGVTMFSVSSAGVIQQANQKSCTLGLTTDASGNINGCVASDQRLKKNILQMSFDPNILNEITPATYVFKATPNTPRVGFVAQDVQKVLPRAVVPAGGSYLGVDPLAISAYLWKFMQVFNKEFTDFVHSTVARMDEQDAKISALQAQVTHQQLQINQLLKYETSH